MKKNMKVGRGFRRQDGGVPSHGASRMTRAAIAALLAVATSATLPFAANAEIRELPSLKASGLTSNASGGKAGQWVTVGDVQLGSTMTTESSFTPNVVNVNQFIFCNRNGLAEQSYSLGIVSSKLRFDYCNANDTYTGGQFAANANAAANTRYVVKTTGSADGTAAPSWTVNGAAQAKAPAAKTFTAAGPLVFFASYTGFAGSAGSFAPTESTLGNPANVQFHYTKVWDKDGELVHWFVPAEDTDAEEGAVARYGLYDKVAEKFYAASGTTALTPPGAVSDGTTFTWISTTGGDMADGANWDQGGVSPVGVKDIEISIAIAKTQSAPITLSGDGTVLDTGASGAFRLGYNNAAATNMTAVVSDGATLRTGAGAAYATTSSIGYGASASNNVLRVENGGRLEALTVNRPLVIGHSGSCGNAVEIVGEGSVFTNLLTAAYPLGSTDNPLCVGGVNSSRNSLVFDGSEGWLGAVGVGTLYKATNKTNPYENLENRLVAKNGATLRVGYLRVAHSHQDQMVADQVAGKRLEGNVVEILSGSSLTVAGTTYVGAHPKASGNRMTVSGEGSKFTFGAVTEEMSANVDVKAHIYVGAFGSDSNRLEVLDGAELVRGTVIAKGKTTARNGTYNILVGAESNDRGSNSEDGSVIRYGGRGNVLAFENAKYKENTSASETIYVGAQKNGDGNALFVGTGAEVKVGVVQMNGFDNRVVVSNGTLEVTATSGIVFSHKDANDEAIAGRHVVRIEGADAKLTARAINARNAAKNTSGTFSGVEILEFAIPAGGWSAAPFVVSSAVTVPAGTKVRVDEKSVKAYVRKNRAGGTVPLLRSTGTITVADMDALSEELPSNVSLVLSADVKTLSCKIKAGGFSIVVR